MGEIIMRNWDLREFLVRVNWPSPIWLVRVPIRRLTTPIWGHLNPLRKVVLLISHSSSDPSYLSHLHPPSHSILSTTLPSSQEHKVESSLSISPCHHHQLILSEEYTENSIHLWLTVVPSFLPFQVDPRMVVPLPAYRPTDPPPPATSP